MTASVDVTVSTDNILKTNERRPPMRSDIVPGGRGVDGR